MRVYISIASTKCLSVIVKKVTIRIWLTGLPNIVHFFLTFANTAANILMKSFFKLKALFKNTIFKN